MRVSIDRDNCISCGSCWQDCPDFFQEGPADGFSQVVERYRLGGDIAEGEAPPDLAACVRQAADDCPVEVIHVS